MAEPRRDSGEQLAAVSRGRSSQMLLVMRETRRRTKQKVKTRNQRVTDYQTHNPTRVLVEPNTGQSAAAPKAHEQRLTEAECEPASILSFEYHASLE